MSLAGGESRLSYLAPSACALVIVDVQRDFCDPEGVLGRLMEPGSVDKMCSGIRALRQAATEAAVPVIFLQTIHRAATDSRAWRNRFPREELSVCREGTWGADFYDAAPGEHDIVVQKHRYSGFHGTELDNVLRSLRRTSVVLAGTATNVCVESTARDACTLDYDVFLVDDATCAGNDAEHAAAVANVRDYFGTVVDAAAVAREWSERSPESEGGLSG